MLHGQLFAELLKLSVVLRSELSYELVEVGGICICICVCIRRKFQARQVAGLRAGLGCRQIQKTTRWLNFAVALPKRRYALGTYPLIPSLGSCLSLPSRNARHTVLRLDAGETGESLLLHDRRSSQHGCKKRVRQT